MSEENVVWNSQHARWLQRSGVFLFLLGLLNGFLVHQQALPRVVLEAHVIALMSGIFLIAVGLVWSRLRLSRVTSWAGFGSAVYGFYAGWMAYLVAGISGTGGMFPLAAGGARGSAVHEGLVSVVLASAALAMIGLCGVVLWGLRGSAPGSSRF